MGVVLLLGRRPVSITRLRDSPCPQSFVVHFKSLFRTTTAVVSIIRVQLVAMQRLFAESGIAVLPGTTEDLSGRAELEPLEFLDVGECRGEVTQDQRDLFANRNNVGSDELVIYIVPILVGPAGNPLGCATHPPGRPGAAVELVTGTDWLVSHEVGHVLGLDHVCKFQEADGQLPAVPCGVGHSDSLMFPNTGWTNLPPNLSSGESVTMRNSGLTRSC
jgi:hypothetical protein